MAGLSPAIQKVPFFGTPCIMMLFVIVNCFLLLATSLHAPPTLTQVNSLCQYLPIVVQGQAADVSNYSQTEAMNWNQ